MARKALTEIVYIYGNKTLKYFQSWLCLVKKYDVIDVTALKINAKTQTSFDLNDDVSTLRQRNLWRMLL